MIGDKLKAVDVCNGLRPDIVSGLRAALGIRAELGFKTRLCCRGNRTDILFPSGGGSGGAGVFDCKLVLQC